MKARDALIRDVLTIIVAELPVLPLHQPITPWAMRKSVASAFSPNNVPYFFRFRLN